MTLRGKGFFIWKIQDCERGDPDAIACAAQEAGFTHVLIKIADGNYTYNVDKTTKIDRVPAVVAALRSRGIQPWGWHYVYGYDPLGEARIAIRRVQEFNLAGYVIDAEVEYKEPGRATTARRYMAELRKALPNFPIALSSFRFPSYHPQLPWREFLEDCDYNMPQVYWEQAHNPSAQLARSLREFRALTPYRPVIPTGPAYKWNGWRPTEDDLKTFLDTVTANDVPAVNFFSWDECRRDLPNLWEIISKYHMGEPAEKPADLPEQYVQALNSRQPQAVTDLYRLDAVHITSSGTVQGHDAIRAWYETFLNQQFPKAAFSLANTAGRGSTRHFTWKAVSPDGSAMTGSDILGMMDEKIIYHYTSYALP